MDIDDLKRRGIKPKECSHCFHDNLPGSYEVANPQNAGSQKCCHCGTVIGTHGPFVPGR